MKPKRISPHQNFFAKKPKQFLQFKEKLYQTQPWIYIGSHINRQPWRATEKARICTNLKDHEIAVCCETHSVMSDSLQPRGLYSAWNSPGQNTGVSKPFPSPGDLPNPGIEPRSPTLQVDSLPAKPILSMCVEFWNCIYMRTYIYIYSHMCMNSKFHNLKQ